ncbi:AI-2E family transporter [Clostridium oceanicum]|uniref:AI-2E family transporter n=1 Tax=Clostridium oceanicum TaxID=1543 RepID=A0ABN1JBH4_9CLOT
MKYYDKYKNLIKCILIFFMFFIVTILITRYFKPFFIIVIISFLASPLYNFLCKHKIFSKKLSAFLSILIVNLSLFIILFFIGNFLVKYIIIIKKNYTNFSLVISNIWSKFNDFVKTYGLDLNNKINNISDFVVNNEIIRKSASYTTEWFLAYIIGNLSTYFILVDKYAIFKRVEKSLSPNQMVMLKDKIYKINQIVKIECVLVLITTFETILGFKILNIDNYFILGIFSGILDILPYLGIAIIFIPLIFYKIYTKNYIIALGLICLYILLMINRNIMETKFMSNKLEVSSLLILISLYIGFKIFGFIGLFVGPMYIITTKEFIKI